MRNEPPFEASAYNRLMDVNSADAKLTRAARAASLQELANIIERNGLEKKLCIRLLHKHNDVSDNERMIEYDSLDQEGFALVTRAIDITSSEYDVVTNSWQLTSTGWMSVEFSKRSLLEEPGINPETQRKAFAEIAEVIERLGLADILGPALSYSAYVDEQRPSDGWNLLERSAIENRANVLRYQSPKEFNSLGNIETKWIAVSQQTVDGKRVWFASARCACSVSPEGGHEGTHVHLPVN